MTIAFESSKTSTAQVINEACREAAYRGIGSMFDHMTKWRNFYSTALSGGMLIGIASGVPVIQQLEDSLNLLEGGNFMQLWNKNAKAGFWQYLLIDTDEVGNPLLW